MHWYINDFWWSPRRSYGANMKWIHLVHEIMVINLGQSDREITGATASGKVGQMYCSANQFRRSPRRSYGANKKRIYWPVHEIMVRNISNDRIASPECKSRAHDLVCKAPLRLRKMKPWCKYEVNPLSSWWDNGLKPTNLECKSRSQQIR